MGEKEDAVESLAATATAFSTVRLFQSILVVEIDSDSDVSKRIMMCELRVGVTTTGLNFVTTRRNETPEGPAEDNLLAGIDGDQYLTIWIGRWSLIYLKERCILQK